LVGNTLVTVGPESIRTKKGEKNTSTLIESSVELMEGKNSWGRCFSNKT